MLNMQIIDADTITPRVLRWGWWHVVVLTDAARKEAALSDEVGIVKVWTLNGGRCEITERREYVDPDDGEVLILNPGDQIEAWG